MPDPQPSRFADWGEGLHMYDADGERTDTTNKRRIAKDDLASLYLDQYYVDRDEWFLDRNLEIIALPLKEFTKAYEEKALEEFYARVEK